jgi:hypothetical protein
MTRFKFLLTRWSIRLGVFGIVGVALLAFCGIFVVSTVLPMRDRSAELRDDLRRVERRKPSDVALPSREQDMRTQLTGFFNLFPDEKSIGVWLGKIHTAADRSHIALRKGDYRIGKTPSDRLTRYQMSFPVQGDYRDIQRFLGDITEQIPAVAVDEISFHRKDVAASRVDCTLRLSLYLKQG